MDRHLHVTNTVQCHTNISTDSDLFVDWCELSKKVQFRIIGEQRSIIPENMSLTHTILHTTDT